MSRTLPARLIENKRPKNVELRASLYSIAAAASGVSALALAQAAVGEVVITNKTIPITLCLSSPCPVLVDLNADGVNDLQFSFTTNYVSVSNTLFLKAKALSGGAIVGAKGGVAGPYASCLLRGAKIGPSDQFLSVSKRDTIEGSHYFYSDPRHYRTLFGKWGGNHPNRFLGVKFKIKGTAHYGWVRITVDSTVSSHDITATITEYGYETVANKSLDAGLSGASSSNKQTQEISKHTHHGPSLGMLVLGMDGLALWRRDETLECVSITAPGKGLKDGATG